MATNKLADFDENDDPRYSSYIKNKDKGNELKKNWKVQATEKENEGGKTRQGDSSYPK